MCIRDRYNTPDWETLRGVNRTQVSDNFKYDISETNFLLGGAGIYNDHGIMVDKSDTTMYYNGKNTINLYNTFGYMEYHASSPYIDLTIGGRIEYHNLFGLSYAPRVGLTKVINKFHYKFLFSKAYKTPSIGNLDYQHNLIPEDAYVMELELGYKLNDNMFITGTFFDITKLRNIVYWDSVTTAEYGYKLGGRTGSRGFEFDYRFRYLWGSLTLNYSYYFGAHKNTIAEYAIPGDLNKYLSAPQNKIAASLMINATEHISITPSLVFMGRRYGYNRWSADTTVLLIKEFDPALLVNIYINCRDVFVKGMNVGFGVYDLLNQKPPYIQPYYGSLPPFTAPSREIIVRLTYNFGFKEK